MSSTRGPAVIDTDVFSADLVSHSDLAQRYAPLIAGRPSFISFQTAAEIRYGALARAWGKARMLKLESKLASVEIVHTGPELVVIHARLRTDCRQAGHALAHRAHNADHWIAATAIRLGVPLVSSDAIFRGFPVSGSRPSTIVKRPRREHCLSLQKRGDTRLLRAQ